MKQLPLPSFVEQQTPAGWGKVARHARMKGTVIVIEPAKYAEYLRRERSKDFRKDLHMSARADRRRQGMSPRQQARDVRAMRRYVKRHGSVPPWEVK